jgi:diguanylate cyclase (GGDEF)-like protein
VITHLLKKTNYTCEKGGIQLENRFHNITVSQITDIIDLLNPYMDDYIFIFDVTHDNYYISPSAVARFNLPASEFNNVMKTHESFVYPDDFPYFESELTDLLSGKKASYDLLCRWISINNEPVWINCRGTLIVNDNGDKYLAGCINDIGKQQMADHVSGLLGLANLETLYNKSYPTIKSGYLMRLGLDDFKDINEQLGIEYGNDILKNAAECIKKCLSRHQYLYKGVADEFVIIDLNGNDVDFATEQYRHIRAAIDGLVIGHHYEAVFTISGGILMSSECSGKSFSDLMKYSEFALNEAKRQGKNRCFVFNNIDYEKFLKKGKLIQIIRTAVNNNYEGFEAYLQPLFDANSVELYGAEALMRFHTEDFGMVSPAEFIPILEETGLIVPVGKWMLCKSLEICSKIHRVMPDFRISINISYIQVLKSNIISEILSAVADYDILPSTVIIELTESGLVATDPRVTKLCSRMKESGIHLALDDFGTGYSNFQYFNDLKPNIIKIDRSFTVKAMQDEYEFNFLSLMTDMAHNMNMKVCVEGIENIDELNKMKTIAPDYCQGYYFGKPCSYEEFIEKFLKKSA